MTGPQLLTRLDAFLSNSSALFPQTAASDELKSAKKTRNEKILCAKSSGFTVQDIRSDRSARIISLKDSAIAAWLSAPCDRLRENV